MFSVRLPDAMTTFHKTRYFHRDICPAVMVNQEDVVKLIDLGSLFPTDRKSRKPGKPAQGRRTSGAEIQPPHLNDLPLTCCPGGDRVRTITKPASLEKAASFDTARKAHQTILAETRGSTVQKWTPKLRRASYEGYRARAGRPIQNPPSSRGAAIIAENKTINAFALSSAAKIVRRKSPRTCGTFVFGSEGYLSGREQSNIRPRKERSHGTVKTSFASRNPGGTSCQGATVWKRRSS